MATRIDRSRKPSKREVHPLYRVTRSKVHGYGAFATRDIKKGETIDEYLGDRITHAQADKRYEDHDENDNHTFLFIVDKKTVIDAGVGGNDARFINHKCDPNCESEIKKGRVFIVATKNIAKGEELGYDYQIGREKDDPENVDEIYACRCGSPKCRGTMLWPPKRPSPRKKRRKSAASARSAAGKPGRKSRSKKTNRTRTKSRRKT
jgi:SET domain-containing protein